MNKRRTLSLVTVLLIIFGVMSINVFTVLGQDGGEVVVASGDPVRVGFAAGLSGEGIAPLGLDEQRGAELALAARPTITVDGVEFVLELDIQDALCSAEGGQTVANRFASDESVSAVIGHMCSSSCTAALPIYDDAGYTMVSPSCTAATLTAEGLLAFNRVVTTDAVQGPVAADFIFNTLGVDSIATIHDGSPYGEGLAGGTSEAFEALGGTVVSAQAITVGDTDFRAVLEEIAGGDPELIYFAGFVAEGARLIEQRADVGLEDVPFMGADGIQAPELIDLAGDASEGVYASAPVPISGDIFDAFLVAYEEAYGEAPIAPFHAHAYDAYNVIASAIEAVGSVDGDGNLHIDRLALSEAIRATDGHEGLTGVITCQSDGECGGAVIDVYQVQMGAFTSMGVADMGADMGGMMGPSVMVAPTDPVVVGFAAGLSGEGIAPLGLDEQRGAELALADRPIITVDGVEFIVELDVQDALCSAEGGQTVANRFASDESISAVIGHMCSSSCTAALPIYDDAGYTMVSPSCTAATLTAEGLLAFNRVVTTDAVQAPVAADFIFNTLGISSIATIHDGSPYGEGLAGGTGEAFEALGGTVVSAQAITVGDTDFRAVLEEIAGGDPGLIYFAGFVAEGARLIEQRADVGLEDVPFMGADGIQAPELIDLAGDASEGVYASAPVPISGDVFDAFLVAYEEAYGEAPIAPFHAHTYDAYNVILNAIEAVSFVDDAGDLVINRLALSEAIRTTEGHEGLTGVITCQDDGECGGAVIEIYVVENGGFVSTQ